MLTVIQPHINPIDDKKDSAAGGEAVKPTYLMASFGCDIVQEAIDIHTVKGSFSSKLASTLQSGSNTPFDVSNKSGNYIPNIILTTVGGGVVKTVVDKLISLFGSTSSSKQISGNKAASVVLKNLEKSMPNIILTTVGGGFVKTIIDKLISLFGGKSSSKQTGENKAALDELKNLEKSMPNIILTTFGGGVVKTVVDKLISLFGSTSSAPSSTPTQTGGSKAPSDASKNSGNYIPSNTNTDASLQAQTYQFLSDNVDAELDGFEPSDYYSFKADPATSSQQMPFMARLVARILSSTMSLLGNGTASSGTNSEGYWEIDYENLEDFYKRTSLMCNLMTMTEMLHSSMIEARNLVDKELRGVEGYQSMNTAKIVQKHVDNRMKRINLTIATLIKDINKKNEDIYNAKIADIEKRYKDKKPGFLSFDGILYGDSKSEIAADKAGEQADATRKYKDACAKNAKAAARVFNVAGLLNKDASAQDVDDLVNNMAADILSGFDSLEHGIDNGYTEVDMDKLMTMRKRLGGCFNIKRAMIMIQMSVQEGRGLVHQELTGVDGPKSNKEALDAMTEEQASHTMKIFDTAANEKIKEVQMKNKEIYLQKQKEKYEKMKHSIWSVFGVIVQIVTIVAAVIVSLAASPLAGLIVAAAGEFLAGELSGIGGIREASMALDAEKECHDQYNPTEYRYNPNYQPANTGNDAVDAYSEVDNAAQGELAGMYTGNPDATFLHFQADGYSSLDSAEIAGHSQKLSRLANIQREIRALYKERALGRSIVHMEMTGIASRETSAAVDTASEAGITQQQAIFQSEVFSMRQINESLNKANYKRKNMEMMESNLGNSYFGLIPFFGPIITHFTSLNTQIDYYEDSMFDNFTTDDLSITRPSGSGEDRLDAIARGSYLDLMNDGLVDAGDGNVAVDADKVNVARKALLRIYNIRESLNKALSAVSQARNLVHMEMTGVRSRVSGELSSEVNTATLQNTLQILRLVEDYLASKVEMANRANKATQEVDHLESKMAVDAMVCTMLFELAVFLMFVCPPAAMIVFDVLITVMEVTDSIQDYNYYSDRARDDMGNLTQISVRNIVDRDNTDAAQNALDRREEQTLGEISMDQIESLNYGYWGVNSGLSSQYSLRIENIYNIRAAIASVRKALNEARNYVHAVMTGIDGRTADYGLAQVSNAQSAALAAIDTLFHRLQEIVERHNNITDAGRQAAAAETQMILSSIKLLLQVAGGVLKNVEGLTGLEIVVKICSTIEAFAQNIVTKLAEDAYDDKAEEEADRKVGKKDPNRNVKQTKKADTWAEKVDAMEEDAAASEVNIGQSELDITRFSNIAQRNMETYEMWQGLFDTLLTQIQSWIDFFNEKAVDAQKEKFQDLAYRKAHLDAAAQFAAQLKVLDLIQKITSPLTLLRSILTTSETEDVPDLQKIQNIEAQIDQAIPNEKLLKELRDEIARLDQIKDQTEKNKQIDKINKKLAKLVQNLQITTNSAASGLPAADDLPQVSKALITQAENIRIQLDELIVIIQASEKSGKASPSLTPLTVKRNELAQAISDAKLAVAEAAAQVAAPAQAAPGAPVTSSPSPAANPAETTAPDVQPAPAAPAAAAPAAPAATTPAPATPATVIKNVTILLNSVNTNKPKESIDILNKIIKDLKNMKINPQGVEQSVRTAITAADAKLSEMIAQTSTAISKVSTPKLNVTESRNLIAALYTAKVMLSVVKQNLAATPAPTTPAPVTPAATAATSAAPAASISAQAAPLDTTLASPQESNTATIMRQVSDIRRQVNTDIGSIDNAIKTVNKKENETIKLLDKAAVDLIEQSKLMTNPQSAQQCIKIAQILEALKTEVKNNPNSSNALAYADKILSEMTEMIDQTSQALPAQATETEQPTRELTVEELRNLLKKASEEYNAAKLVLKDAKQNLEIVKKAQSEVENACTATENIMIQKRDLISKKMHTIDVAIQKYEDLLANTQTEGSRNVIQQQIESLKGELNALANVYENIQWNVRAAETAVKAVNKELENAQRKVDEAMQKVVDAKQNINGIQKLLVVAIKHEEEKRKGKEKKDNRSGNLGQSGQIRYAYNTGSDAPEVGHTTDYTTPNPGFRELKRKIEVLG